MERVITPDWPAPARVKSLMTTREEGVSAEPYASWNLGDHVQDDSLAVAANRALLRQNLPAEPVWLNQVHGTLVVQADAVIGVPDADAAFTRQPGTVCAVLTADCLPVLFCARDGSVVAAAHAGWRGLAAGVLEATVTAMRVPSNEVLVWMGAAIGPTAFTIGSEVRDTFISTHPESTVAFSPHQGKWKADIYRLARIRLASVGVADVYGGDHCTVNEVKSFFSYRRSGRTGRMASLIWIERAG